METTYWLKQTKDKPLYPDLLWSRPQTASRGGKLLIIGGDSHGFAKPAEAFLAAKQSEAGVIKVILPDHVKSSVPKNVWANFEFVPSIKNGGFARMSVAEMAEVAGWADGVLIAGGVGRNSETAIAIEAFIKQFKGKLAITHDALDLVLATPQVVFERPNTLAVASFGQLQKALLSLRPKSPITYGMDLIKLVKYLSDLTIDTPAAIMTKHQDQIIVALAGKVSTTPSKDKIWRTKTAAKAATWWIQNPDKPFEAITTSLIA